MVFNNYRYVIIPTTKISQIDFDQVMETSAETCRYSVDGSKTFVKYAGEQPSSVADIDSCSREYSHSEILKILSTAEWINNISEPQ